jgi:hypothetical protein
LNVERADLSGFATVSRLNNLLKVVIKRWRENILESLVSILSSMFRFFYFQFFKHLR